MYEERKVQPRNQEFMRVNMVMIVCYCVIFSFIKLCSCVIFCLVFLFDAQSIYEPRSYELISWEQSNDEK